MKAELINKLDDWGLHWFRRDLRIAGNEALRENWQKCGRKTLGIFCFDSRFLSRPDFSNNRFAFFLDTLAALRRDWAKQGGSLLVVDGMPHDVFSQLISFLQVKGIPLPRWVTWNRDYEAFARERDQKISSLLQSFGIKALSCRDHLLFEPHEILKSAKPDDYYQIYSPFSKRWFAKLSSEEGRRRILAQSRTLNYFNKIDRQQELFRLNWNYLETINDFPFSDALARFIAENRRHTTIALPEAGFFSAYKKLLSFKDRLERYHETRDFPAQLGTSNLSKFLKNGSLSSAQIVATLQLSPDNWQESSGQNQYLKEIAWREFYYSILYHQPSVETSSFNPKYRDLPWSQNAAWFERWKEGTTGFPIVDAGMRQLRSTGWMHNRVRMIVASFLTKDLLLDWRLGENYFMRQLLDGDLAPNNGGWQWAASTGCDPQPYFRVFNPWLQGQKFDPDGEYIKQFVPELKNVASKNLHHPDADRSPGNYPSPMVDHTQQKYKAIEFLKGRKI